MSSREQVEYMVWTGASWLTTRAVSEAKAISNVAWRMRQAGKFPCMSEFRAEVAKEVRDGEVKK